MRSLTWLLALGLHKRELRQAIVPCFGTGQQNIEFDLVLLRVAWLW